MPTVTIHEALQIALHHQQAGELKQAESIYRHVLQHEPHNLEALHLLGVLNQQLGRNEAAVELIGRAIAVNPTIAELYYHYAMAWRGLGRVDEAIDALRIAVHLSPEYHEAYNNLGVLLEERRRFEDAIQAYQKVVQLKPDDHEAYTNLGAVLERLGRVDEAIEAWDKALRLKPNYAPARWNRAVALLLCGDYVRGWREYEWRWENFPSRWRQFEKPRWDGLALAGRTILLHAEQGFGDTVHFVRYAPLVAQHGGKVILECHAELASLLGRVEGVKQTVVAKGPLPAYDVHCPLLSLPLMFHTTVRSIPAHIPYITPAPQRVERWREKLQGDAAGLRVGLAWAGRADHPNDAQRSVKLRVYGPLGKAAGVTFYSLQKGPSAAQAMRPPAGLKLVDYTDELHDFSETAALMANLDLVISVDTVIAHLAGAMGKRAWTLLPFAPDYRWMLDRDDSPWYPGMRLFRQPAIGDWGTVVQIVLRELQAAKSERRTTNQ